MKTIFRTIVVLLVLVCAGCAPSAVKSLERFEAGIVPVRTWGGTPFEGEARLHTITSITLHHAGEDYPKGAIPEHLVRLQNWSRTTKKWIDIPYHYLIDREGIVYEGRLVRYAGDTNTKYDPAGHALICVLGNFENDAPNEKQLHSVVQTMTWLAWKYHLSPETIKGHRDVADSTVCPGKNLYEYLTSGYFKKAVTENLHAAGN